MAPRSQCRGPGSISVQRIRAHMTQLRFCTQQLKILQAITKLPHMLQQKFKSLYAATKTRNSQINKQIFFKDAVTQSILSRVKFWSLVSHMEIIIMQTCCWKKKGAYGTVEKGATGLESLSV